MADDIGFDTLGAGDDFGAAADTALDFDLDAMAATTEEEGQGAPAPPEDSTFDILNFHPEMTLDYAETVAPKIQIQVAPPIEGQDPNHTSPPFLTIYERTKILGTRTNQLAEGAKPFVSVPDYVTEPLEIAKMELEQRRLPFIVKRPMPDGTFEYWRLSDLLLL